MPRAQSQETISRRMATVRSRNTGPELSVRSIVHRYGLRFRLTNRDLPGSPDLVNRSRKWAVFVHGCFWHRHRGCPRTTTPKRNAEFWRAKFRANVLRDRRKERELTKIGYSVLVLWECQAEDPRELSRLLKASLSRRQ